MDQKHLVEKEIAMDSRENVKIEVSGTKVIVTLETDPGKVQIAPSATRKSDVYATTGGACTVGDGFKLNLTLYRKRS